MDDAQELASKKFEFKHDKTEAENILYRPRFESRSLGGTTDPLANSAMPLLCSAKFDY
jgi:hypothetical protein